MKLKKYIILLIGIILTSIGWIMTSDVVIVSGYVLIVIGIVNILFKGNIKAIITTCIVIALVIVSIIFLDWMSQTKPFDILTQTQVEVLASSHMV